MSVQTEIDRIITAVGAAYDAVEAKGGTAPAAQTIEGIAGAISGIKSAPTTPYMEVEYVAVDSLSGTVHYIKRAKLYNHTAIYASEFSEQHQLQNLDFSDASNNITVIEELAFERAQVNGLVLPNTISALHRLCFNGAYIATLVVPPLVTVLPESAFSYTQPVYNNETGEELPINIILPQNLTKIDIGCFEGAPIKQITIPDTVTEIGDRAFFYCAQLASITLPLGIQKISDRMLYGCISLTSITIPASVTEIGIQAFAYSGVTEITIPASVTSIGDYAFTQNEDLYTVTCLAATPPTLGNGAFGPDPAGLTIKVPAASVAAYKAADGWKDYASYIVAM